MNWTPLFADLIESSIWDLPDHVRLSWIAILSKKDFRTHTVRMNAHRLSKWANITVEKAADAILVLSSPDESTLTQELEGRRIVEESPGLWRVVNGEHYKQLIMAQKNREDTKNRMQENRATKYSDDSKAVLAHLRSVSGRNFREVGSNLTEIDARLNEDGVDVDGCKKMIDRQALMWKDDDVMSEYLRPSTLFRKSKFDAYYASKDVPVKGKEHIVVDWRKETGEQFQERMKRMT